MILLDNDLCQGDSGAPLWTMVGDKGKVSKFGKCKDSVLIWN